MTGLAVGCAKWSAAVSAPGGHVARPRAAGTEQVPWTGHRKAAGPVASATYLAVALRGSHCAVTEIEGAEAEREEGIA